MAFSFPRFTSSPPFTIASFLIAITCKIIHSLFYFRFGGDQTILLQRAHNLILGNGLSVTRYYHESSQPVFDSTPYWPPGYSILAAPFMALFNNDPLLVSLIIEIAVNISIIFCLWFLLHKINAPVAASNFMILFYGSFEFPFITRALPTDSLALLSLLIAILAVLNVLQKPKLSILSCFLVGFVFFLPSFLRYAYLPISIFLPFIPIIHGSISRSKAQVGNGLILLGYTTAFILLMLVTQLLSTGQATYQLPVARGFFPENLNNWYPFAAASLANPDLICSKLASITSLPFESWFYNLHFLNIPAVVLLGFILISVLKKRSITDRVPRLAFIICISISAIIIATLAGLSLTSNNYVRDHQRWNFIQEGRYYAFIFLFLQGTIVYSAIVNNSMRSRFWQWLSVTLFAVLMLSSLHGLYHASKIAVNFNSMKAEYRVDRDFAYFDEFLEGQDKNLLIASSDNSFNELAILKGFKAVTNPKDWMVSSKASSQKMLLVIYERERPEFEPHFHEHDLRLISQVDKTLFYLSNSPTDP